MSWSREHSRLSCIPLIELQFRVGSLFLWDEWASIMSKLIKQLEWHFIVDSVGEWFSNDTSYSGLPYKYSIEIESGKEPCIRRGHLSCTPLIWYILIQVDRRIDTSHHNWRGPLHRFPVYSARKWDGWYSTMMVLSFILSLQCSQQAGPDEAVLILYSLLL